MKKVTDEHGEEDFIFEHCIAKGKVTIADNLPPDLKKYQIPTQKKIRTKFTKLSVDLSEKVGRYFEGIEDLLKFDEDAKGTEWLNYTPILPLESNDKTGEFVVCWRFHHEANLIPKHLLDRSLKRIRLWFYDEFPKYFGNPAFYAVTWEINEGESGSPEEKILKRRFGANFRTKQRNT